MIPDTWTFLWVRSGISTRSVSIFPPAAESSKCCLASEAACEAQFGEGCHLKGDRSAAVTAPQALSSTPALPPPPPPPRYRSIAATLHTSSHTSSSHLPAAFILAASKPDAPSLEGRGRECRQSSLTLPDGSARWTFLVLPISCE